MVRNKKRHGRKPPACPECGAKEAVPIVYGFPGRDVCLAVERGEIAIGGCVLEPDQPAWACPACRHRW